MTANQNFNNHEDKSSAWTTAGVIDDLFLQLCTTRKNVIDNSNNESKEIKASKYYIQAWDLLPSISAGDPPPYFTIYLSDLRPDLLRELNHDQSNRDFVILQAIGRLFENISPRQYHLSIAKDYAISWCPNYHGG